MTNTDRITNLLNAYPVGAKACRVRQPKPSGGVRLIAKPDKELKKWLRAMNKELCKQFNNWPSFMHGGIKKRSYVSFARPHVGKKQVIMIDIKDCFDSINEQEVANIMQIHLKLNLEICNKLAHVLCYDGKIAQGFSTSNFICNLCLLQPLTDLNNRLRRQNIIFGNYVDDLAVSGVIKNPDDVINDIAITLSRARLRMNKAKVKVMSSSTRQVVCGLVVNRRLSLTKSLKLRLLSDIAHNRMSSASAGGWIANLANVDLAFRRKLYKYAVDKKLLKQL